MKKIIIVNSHHTKRIVLTDKDFKSKYPEYEHLRGNELWEKAKEITLAEGEHWIADYSEGYNTLEVDETLEFRENSFWINSKTKERITNEEFKIKGKEYISNNKEATLQATFTDYLNLNSEEKAQLEKDWNRNIDNWGQFTASVD